MIITIFVPLVSKMSETDRLYLRSQGKEQEQKDKLSASTKQAIVELDEALDSGFTVIHAEKVEDSRAVYFTYMLFKSDLVEESDEEQSEELSIETNS